jgi:pimeloyl-ACP methyl ester carboxylesterase
MEKVMVRPKLNNKRFKWSTKRFVGLSFIIGLLLIVSGFFVLRRNQSSVIDSQEKIIVFNAKESADSNRMIARKAIFIKRPGAKATVMICHGFMCNKHDISFLRSIFNGYNILIFDFRAHGELSDGQCCSFGYNEAYDVLGAADFVKSDPQIGKLPLFAYGFSMGAASAILAQEKDTNLFDGLVLDCPFDSSDGIIGRGIDHIKVRMFGYEFSLPGRGLLRRYAYSRSVQKILKMVLRATVKLDSRWIRTCLHPIAPMTAAKSIDKPCLFITCKNDIKAPVHAVKAVYDGVLGYKRLWITNGRRHFDSFFYSPDRYATVVRNFIQDVLRKDYIKKEHAKIVHDLEDDEMILVQGTELDPYTEL